MSSGDKSSLEVSFSRVPDMETTKLSIRSTFRRVSRVETALRMERGWILVFRNSLANTTKKKEKKKRKRRKKERKKKEERRKKKKEELASKAEEERP